MRYFTGDFGSTTTLYTLAGSDRRIYKWWSSNGALGDVAGAEFSIRGTVKKLDEYQGHKATVLTRCKVLQSA